jgi:uncharacterized protein (DUF1015 family)
MADVRPFRAVRYDEAAAGPLETLVAPPYDVISPAERGELAARSPYNVVHLTLPEDEEQAARDLASWQEQGVLVEDAEPAVWALQQDYVGPDGVARSRCGLLASLRVEPYERRVVLPHERTHAGPKEGRLRLLRATGMQLEPIFLLYDGAAPFAPPERAPDLDVAGARMWRLDDAGAVTEFFADRELLIADGHHRYETALAYAADRGTPESARMPVVLVSTDDPGLTIFPTHRVVEQMRIPSPEYRDPDEAWRALDACPPDRAAALLYTRNGYTLVHGRNGARDAELLEDFDPHGISYTPEAAEAVLSVDRGDAAGAFLLRPARLEDVFAVARRGEVLPQKSTYFFPKLLSGLVFHPV